MRGWLTIHNWGPNACLLDDPWVYGIETPEVVIVMVTQRDLEDLLPEVTLAVSHEGLPYPAMRFEPRS